MFSQIVTSGTWGEHSLVWLGELPWLGLSKDCKATLAFIYFMKLKSFQCLFGVLASVGSGEAWQGGVDAAWLICDPLCCLSTRCWLMISVQQINKPIPQTKPIHYRGLSNLSSEGEVRPAGITFFTGHKCLWTLCYPDTLQKECTLEMNYIP